MEDDVCLDVLDVLAAWSCVQFFLVRVFYVFFPSQIGPSPYINQVIIFLIFSPSQAKLRFKILTASSLYSDDECREKGNKHHTKRKKNEAKEESSGVFSTFEYFSCR